MTNWYRDITEKLMEASEDVDGFKQRDGHIVPYKTWHNVSDIIAIMPMRTTYRVKLLTTGEIDTPKGPAGRDALMMALWRNIEPHGYASHCFGEDYRAAHDKPEVTIDEEDEGVPTDAPVRKTRQDIDNFCKAVEEKIRAHYAENLSSLPAPTITFKISPKFARIIVNNSGGSGRSVFCFVDMATGNILKAASWSAPAQGVRGNISNGATDITPYGAKYLRY